MNWPNKYAAGITCGWEVFAPLGHVILVEVTDFWIGGGSSPGCASAFLAITGNSCALLATSHVGSLYICQNTPLYIKLS